MAKAIRKNAIFVINVNIMDQPKLERMLRLMKYLSGNVNYSIEELSRKLEMSPRTVYRYIDTFKSAGFAVTKLYGDIYKLAEMPKETLELEKLIYFSEEEAYLVNSLIDQLVPTNSLKANLKEKLSAIYRSTSIADFVGAKSNAAHVDALGKAAQDKLKARLKDYESGNSHTIRDRLVEPFGFTSDYADVWAFDLEDGRNKTFKISRIGGEVEILDEPWTEEPRHRRSQMDVFRMTGDKTMRIILSMSLMAKNLLEEEYPMAASHIRQDSGRWILDTEICQLQGAARFVSGLMGEIEILQGKELKAYLAEYGQKYFK
ncbi:MAG: WYL domain-containing protein [Bacteroidales bacterium]|nr:WYL domain-containing protein [Bacteroidales bacterium]